ncbi:hypothetical protein BKA80DRAFT_12514 [Phyllosticta citrichinensis]
MMDGMALNKGQGIWTRRGLLACLLELLPTYSGRKCITRLLCLWRTSGGGEIETWYNHDLHSRQQTRAPWREVTDPRTDDWTPDRGPCMVRWLHTGLHRMGAPAGRCRRSAPATAASSESGQATVLRTRESSKAPGWRPVSRSAKGSKQKKKVAHPSRLGSAAPR